MLKGRKNIFYPFRFLAGASVTKGRLTSEKPTNLFSICLHDVAQW